MQTFGSKNEWKRHTLSQHMQLYYWQCNLCCDHQGTESGARFFNRKDLFGQHLKRMHPPHSKKNTALSAEQKTENERWENEDLSKIQDECVRISRDPPAQSLCEVCKQEFDGEKSWDAKLEHMGAHYEKDEKPKYKDTYLITWAVKEGLVSRAGEFKYEFTKGDSIHPPTKIPISQATFPSSHIPHILDEADDNDMSLLFEGQASF